MTNKPGGNPTPVFLTNVTMETYFQGGIEAACNIEELPPGVACPSNPAIWTTPQNNQPPPANLSNSTQIFGSEKMGQWTS